MLLPPGECSITTPAFFFHKKIDTVGYYISYNTPGLVFEDIAREINQSAFPARLSLEESVGFVIDNDG